ncbi:MAG: polymerase sigma-70 factor, expansion family 1 [Mucilaginibacter sp.]|nr:polymerase sigma-70 factor, expansion family 1 [Mucilaginibacter sp.]
MSAVSNRGTEDKLLLQQLRDGSTFAYRALYEKYWEQTYNNIYKRLKDQEQAEDLTQDVFMQLWIKREETHIENLPAYLYVTARNSVYKSMGKQSKFVPIDDLLENLAKAENQTDARLLKNEFMKAYEALIDTLPLAQQTIFRMRYNECLSPDEIAEALDLSPKTVRNQLGKALIKVKATLGLLSLIAILTQR